MSSKVASRSKYVLQLRRAFLLRVHPDHYRSQPEHVRRNQAQLVQAMEDRMGQADFIRYMDGASSSSSSSSSFPPMTGTGTKTPGQNDARQEFSYVLQHPKDQSLKQHRICLNDSVEKVLGSMVNALTSLGVKLPPPPPLVTSAPVTDPVWLDLGRLQRGGSSSSFSQSHHEHDRDFLSRFGSASAGYQTNDNSNSNGRSLSRFLATVDREEVKKRKASRLDAQAAAMVARRTYGFVSVDGTRVGWSSESMAACLHTLLDLYREHSSKLDVPSFYPFRVELSSDDTSTQRICVYSGCILLNPAATPLQWLELLLMIHDDTLTTLRRNQQRLHDNLKRIQTALGGVRIRKGYSCQAKEYHEWIDRLATFVTESPSNGTATALAPRHRVRLVAESRHTCRRGRVTEQGDIQVGVGMDPPTVLATLVQRRDEAVEIVDREETLRRRSRELMELVKGKHGLHQISVLRQAVVKTHDLHDCLTHLLRYGQDHCHPSYELRGSRMGITGKGQFCRLGDDGSIIIPCDWQS